MIDELVFVEQPCGLADDVAEDVPSDNTSEQPCGIADDVLV